jgi:hypothetical protein
MASLKLLKHQKRENPNASDLWMLPDTPRVTPTKKAHEIAKGELYVAYNKVEEWYNELLIGEGLRSDCSMLYGVRVHFEVDLGTEAMDSLFEKVDKYIRYCPRDEKTIFVLRDGIRRTAKTTGSNLNAYLYEKRRGKQFSFTRLDLITSDPYGKWLFNPLQDEPLNLDELCEI